jgi:hypothetical protein
LRAEWLEDQRRARQLRRTANGGQDSNRCD